MPQSLEMSWSIVVPAASVPTLQPNAEYLVARIGFRIVPVQHHLTIRARENRDQHVGVGRFTQVHIGDGVDLLDEYSAQLPDLEAKTLIDAGRVTTSVLKFQVISLSQTS